MIPTVPQEESGQLELKRDEVKTIEKDLIDNKRLLELAIGHSKEGRAKELKDEISTQEKYLKDLAYDIKVLEISSDGEEDSPEEEGKNSPDDEPEGSAAEESDRDGGQASGEDAE